MNNQKSEIYFLLFLLIGVLVLTFFIFKPFLFAVVIAVVIATIFKPVHNRVLHIFNERAGISAFVTTLFILTIVVIPLTLLSVQIFKEATQLYIYLVTTDGNIAFSSGISHAIGTLNEYLPVPIESSGEISQYIQQGVTWLVQNFGLVFSNVANAFVGVFIFLVALYYIFKDGHKLKKTIIDLSPLQNIYDESIFSKLGIAINSIVRGSLFVALIQGCLTTLGFLVFGVPNAILWGSMAAIAALVPAFGTALIIIPGVLYLFITGQILMAVGLLIWGIVAVGLVDNFLGPLFVEKNIRIHSFLILLSILGGISFFGAIGFLLGPLVLALLFALLEIYGVVTKAK